MRKYLAVTLLLLFLFSILASVQTAHATSPIKLDQKTVNVNVADLDIGAYASFGGKITSWKDGDDFIVTIDGEMGVSMIGDIIFYMPYWLDDSKDSVVTNVEYSQYGGVGTANVLVGNEQVTCLLGGWAGWNIHIECCFANYGDSSVVMSVQACAGENDDWEDVELSLLGKKLTISATFGGTTNPAPGTYTYDYGSSVTVTAQGYSGYIFDYWILDGATKYGNEITVTMDSDHDLTAYFEYIGYVGGCPTLFVWNGSGYVDYGVIDIHNPTGEDIVREVPVQAEDVGISNYKATFRLREGWEGLNFSESVIDQVKLYAINEDGKLKLCPLLSATHSRLGDVRESVVSSDDVKVQTLLLETIDLTFKVREDFQGFVFVIEGCNLSKV